jgi:acetyltransferase-like isoleucine patch superfamily enzyme
VRVPTLIRAVLANRRRKATLSSNVEVGRNFRHGDDSFIWAPQRLIIGNDFSIGSRVRIEVDGQIGDAVIIANSAGVIGRTDHQINQVGIAIKNSRWVGSYPAELSQETVIGSDVWIGFGAIILSGIVIGDSSVVGAGSVVTKDVPPNTIVAGNPARVVRRRFTELEYEQHWHGLTRQGFERLAP